MPKKKRKKRYAVEKGRKEEAKLTFFVDYKKKKNGVGRFCGEESTMRSSNKCVLQALFLGFFLFGCGVGFSSLLFHPLNLDSDTLDSNMKIDSNIARGFSTNYDLRSHNEQRGGGGGGHGQRIKHHPFTHTHSTHDTRECQLRWELPIPLSFP